MELKKIYFMSVASVILMLFLFPLMFITMRSYPFTKIIFIIVAVILTIIFGLTSLYCIYKLEITYKKSDPRSSFYLIFLLVELIFAGLWKFKVFTSPNLFEEVIIEPFVALTFIPAILIFIALLLKYILSRPQLQQGFGGAN